jgi:hypothetical protein
MKAVTNHERNATMENMKVWDLMKAPPPSALKKITGGRLSGMTDIKPMWRVQKMTEIFGAIGQGWHYEVLREWTEQGSDGQVFAFVTINLYTVEGGECSNPIHGSGGSMLITKEKAGLHCNDEAFKMATTDALSTAMSKLGVAAEVYLGNWNGSKYLTSPQTPKKAPRRADPPHVEDHSATWLLRSRSLFKKATTVDEMLAAVATIADAREKCGSAELIEDCLAQYEECMAEGYSASEVGRVAAAINCITLKVPEETDVI